MSISRRKFLESSSAVALGFFGLRQLLVGTARAEISGYGPLVPDPDGMLDLPKGFAYKVLSRAGERMNDGYALPGEPDGMAAFPGPEGLTVLVRNHELMPGANPYGEKIPEKIYDRGQGKTPGLGGTTTLVYDTSKQAVVRQFLSLAGTMRNCAGGPTPWNSWISCEEAVHLAGEHEKGEYVNAPFVAEKDHGYNFDVPATAAIGMVDPVPLKAMGRFNHEAVAVEPESGHVFQTEDRPDGLIYRFLPRKPGQLAFGGKLQALKAIDHPSLDTRNWAARTVSPGKPLKIEWVTLEDVDGREDDLRYRGSALGAARFARGEGMWRGADGIYFACTNGGKRQLGQVWRLRPEAETLELFVESEDSQLVKNCDNVTWAPWGDLILCEDRGGDQVRLVGVTPAGEMYNFAHNHKKTEFAGATFSPDGTTLFVNLQGAGLTLAITGPWRR